MKGTNGLIGANICHRTGSGLGPSWSWLGRVFLSAVCWPRSGCPVWEGISAAAQLVSLAGYFDGSTDERRRPFFGRPSSAAMVVARRVSFITSRLIAGGCPAVPISSALHACRRRSLHRIETALNQATHCPPLPSRIVLFIAELKRHFPLKFT